MKIRPFKSSLGSIAGLHIVGIYTGFLLLSRLLFPTAYSPMVNWLSDLGNSMFNPKGAILYNLGCVLTALFEIRFMIGLSAWRVEKKWQEVMLRIGQVAGCLAGFCLMMLGIISADFWSIHIVWAAINVFALAFFLIFVSAVLISDPRYWRAVGVVGFGVATINMVFGLSVNIPIMEWVAIFGAVLFMGLLAVNMLKIKKNKRDQ